MRLKSVGAPTRLLINGYIRQCQDELFGAIADDNPYYNIPQLINNHCMLFYDTFTWYRKQHGKGIEFLSDTEVKMNERLDAICMFQTEIASRVCNKFDITFKIKAFGDDRDYPRFAIGYTYGDSLEESVIDWNYDFALRDNKDNSSEFVFHTDTLWFVGNNDANQIASLTYSLGDMVKLSIDFQNNKVVVHHNGTEMDYQNFEHERVWVGLCLMNLGEIIEMVEYKFD